MSVNIIQLIIFPSSSILFLIRFYASFFIISYKHILFHYPLLYFTNSFVSWFLLFHSLNFCNKKRSLKIQSDLLKFKSTFNDRLFHDYRRFRLTLTVRNFFLQITLLFTCFNIFVAAFSDPLKIITDVVCLTPFTLFINFLFNSPKGQTIKKAYP